MIHLQKNFIFRASEIIDSETSRQANYKIPNNLTLDRVTENQQTHTAVSKSFNTTENVNTNLFSFRSIFQESILAKEICHSINCIASSLRNIILNY